MTEGDDEPADREVAAVLSDAQEIGRGHYRYERYHVTLEGADLERDVMRIGRIVVVLPVDLERREVVMLRQFRLGAHFATGKGELVEVVAGHVEKGESVVTSARRECEEEIGVTPSSLIPLFDLIPTPGASDEHMFFFLGVVDASRVPESAGAAHETEHTRPLRLPIERALEVLHDGRIHNGPAVTSLLWLALNHGRLADIVRQGTAR